MILLEIEAPILNAPARTGRKPQQIIKPLSQPGLFFIKTRVESGCFNERFDY
jgi:hypothetical protein